MRERFGRTKGRFCSQKRRKTWKESREKKRQNDSSPSLFEIEKTESLPRARRSALRRLNRLVLRTRRKRLIFCRVSSRDKENWRTNERAKARGRDASVARGGRRSFFFHSSDWEKKKKTGLSLFFHTCSPLSLASVSLARTQQRTS